MSAPHVLVTATWWAAAGIRSVRTAAQAAVALIGTNVVGITDVEWLGVASASALAAVLSLLTGLAGLPELETSEPGTTPSSVDPEV